MRKSHIAMLAAVGAVLLLITAAVIAARMIVAQIEGSEPAGEESARAQRSEQSAPASERPNLSGFDRIDARGSWRITLTQGTEFGVALTYPENFAERMRVRVEADRLVLAYQGSRGWRFPWWPNANFGDDGEFTATIVMPDLTAADLSGAAQLDLSGFSGELLEIKASGAAEINGSDGRYDELSLVVSGAGDVDLEGVTVTDARVVLSGAGEVTLTMDGGTLSGTISGAGEVKYRGTVSDENIVTSGFSSVEPIR